MIHHDQSLLAEMHNAARFCEWCQRDIRQAGSLEVHHIRARGMGGGARLDIRVNLIVLCGPWGGNCHQLAQEGEIPSLSLYRISGEREGVTGEEAEAAVWEILRHPKHRPLPERLRRLIG